MAALLIESATALLPVVVFLLSLVYLDSFKLVRFRAVLVTILAGSGVAFGSLLLNTWTAETFGLHPTVLTRYAGPVIEELIKAAIMIILLRSNRVGFMVDAAIRGFAVGAGFALVENLYYISARPDAHLYVWVIRGFGTALMHGGATAIVGVMTKALFDRSDSHRLLLALPGLLAAVALHMLFNHFILSPLVSTLMILVILPLALTLVFRRSEQATREWLGVGFDSDRELLEMVTTGNLTDTRVGQYLQTLQARFPGEVVADMLCFLRTHVELAIQAKGMLLMKEAGFKVVPDPEIDEKLTELRYLQKSIGRTGRLALHPVLHTRSRDLWQLQMLTGG